MDEIIYLDHAATSFPKPAFVHDAVREFYGRFGVSPGRSGSDLALHAERLVHRTRQRLSALFHGGRDEGDPDRLVFTHNATMGLNLVLNGTVGPGDHVVTTHTEHNSVIRPVNHAVRAGASATFVRPDDQGYVDPEDLGHAIRGETALVLVNHASNVVGAVQDLDAIGAVCAEAGVPLCVDAAQTAGVLPIDMARSHIAFLVFTGHKGLLGPTGTGGICVADGAEIRGTLFGGTGVRSASPLHLEAFPYRLEAGTLNLAGIAGLAAGLDWIEERGMAAILDHELRLVDQLQQGLAAIPGVTLWGTTSLEGRAPVLSMTLANYDPQDVGTLLDVDYGVQTRTGLHCAPLMHAHLGTAPRGAVRFSVGPLNTEEHIAAVVRAVAEIAALRPA